jgi:hypothetical protein
MARGYAGLHVYPSRTFIPTHHSGAPAPGDGPTYAKQYWGSTHGYDQILAMGAAELGREPTV